MEPQVRFCTTSDGVRIAYYVMGEGPPVIYVPGWISHLELDWQLPLVRRRIEQFARHFTYIRLDKRGTGLSDRNVADYSLEARTLDIEAVADHLKLRRFSLDGISEGGPTCISYAARNPRRVECMALYGTFARGALTGSDEMRRGMISVVRAEWGLGSKLLSDLFLGENADPGSTRLFAEYQQRGATAEDALAMMETNLEMDVTELLPNVRAPTLVVHGRHDRIVPIELGREIAAGIPNSRFLSMDGPHVSLDEQRAEQIDRAQIDFLLENLPASPGAKGTKAGKKKRQAAEPGLVTVLFTDVVESTALTQRLGDTGARQLMREHERITRQALSSHGGSEVKTMGDGFMASFSSATSALECAIAMQQAFAERNQSADEPIHVRVGLNAGEPIAEDEDLFGTAVIVAARIAAQAQGGEILSANVVRELAAGKGFLFADRGETTIRGFEDPVRLFEVRWRE